MGLEVIAIVLSLGLLMAFAYRGLPVIVFAPVFALLAVALSGLPLLPSFTESFMGHAAGYIKVVLPAVPARGDLRQADGDQRRGRVDRRGDRAGAGAAAGDRGGGAGVCHPDVRRGLALRGRLRGLSVRGGDVPRGRDPQAADPRRDRAGGVHLHDGRPAGLAPDPEPDPHPLLRHRRLRRAAGGHHRRGGDPDRRASPGSSRRRARAAAAGEGYGEPSTSPRRWPVAATVRTWSLAVLPLVLVVAANFVLSRTSWSVAGWYSEADLKRTFPTLDVKAVVSTWALIVALTLGIVAVLLIHRRRVMATLPAVALGGDDRGAAGDLQHGLGGRVRQRGQDHAGVPDDPATASSSRAGTCWSRRRLAVNVLAGITGSASGGLSIALDVMGQQLPGAGPGTGDQPRTPPPDRLDGLGRHGHAPAQRRRDHAAGDHGADPPASRISTSSRSPSSRRRPSSSVSAFALLHGSVE